MLRRNRSFLVKVLLFIPLTWLCVVLYMNSSTKFPSGNNGPAQPDDQIVYIQDSNKLEEEIQEHQKQILNEKLPPLKDNQPRKKKLTPPGERFK